MTEKPPLKANLVWKGRPAVGSLIAIYGLISIIVIVVLVTIEWYVGNYYSIGKQIFPNSITVGSVTIPYPVELATAVIILLVYLGAVVQLLWLRARNSYELYSDGLYVNTGLINLENVYVAPMAFSDARLIRTWVLRLVNKGLIIIDTNDGRHFQLKYIRNAMEVQSLIRQTLGHPSVRIG